MEIVKAYVNPDFTALLVCPHCGMSRSTNVEKYAENKDPLRVKCRCAVIYGVNLEFRRQYRKKTNLPGRYTIMGPPNRIGPMIVVNVSMGGIGFVTKGINPLKVGDKVEVDFKLDDVNQSQVKRNAVVRVVDESFVGVQFTGQSGVYDAALGFYLRG
ncbi:MAG: PilZ domain-containing protein [Desulfatibacillaceae bacterium]|nr:PilZ domain-containing protein [Desulfatibacillaceae bacterium]